jgi:peptidoglycan/xylan/chitin deacetylase (PgdA/CDA1 family)
MSAADSIMITDQVAGGSGGSGFSCEERMEREIVLTFDDSDPEHYTIVFPLLRKYGFRAVFAVVTSRPFAGWECAREMAAAGHRLVSHSHTHQRPSGTRGAARPRTDRRQEVADAAGELSRSVALLRRHGCFADGFVYPFGCSGAWASHLLRKNGIRWAMRSEPGYRGTKNDDFTRDPYHIPRAGAFRRPSQGWRTIDRDVDFKLVFERFQRRLAGIAEAQRLVILTFHAVGRDGGWDNVPVVVFEQMLDYLHRNRYRTTTELPTSASLS